jgi:hypothetical protein
MMPPTPTFVTPSVDDYVKEDDKADRQQCQRARLIMPQLLKVIGNIADDHAPLIYTTPNKNQDLLFVPFSARISFRCVFSCNLLEAIPQEILETGFDLSRKRCGRGIILI